MAAARSSQLLRALPRTPTIATTTIPRTRLPLVFLHTSPSTSHAHALTPPHPHSQSRGQAGEQRRPFLTALAGLGGGGGSSGSDQVVTARARLPYHHGAVYERIADIDSYPTFLPYCAAARVTAWTAPLPLPYAYPTTPGAQQQREGEDAGNVPTRRWPTRADLTVGWGGIQETYTSRVFCAPALASSSLASSSARGGGACVGVVEAISGPEGRTELSDEDLARWGLARDDPGLSFAGGSGSGSESGGVFKSLITRWTVTDATPAGSSNSGGGAGGFQTDVRLDIKYRFANPLYGAVSSAVADRLAPVMIDAFVAQAARVLSGSGSGPGRRGNN